MDIEEHRTVFTAPVLAASPPVFVTSDSKLHLHNLSIVLIYTPRFQDESTRKSPLCDDISNIMAQSPASSPRLPSPPPMAEDQIGPTSPSVNASEDFLRDHTFLNNDQAASRRILPGTRSEDMHEGPPLVDLQEVYLNTRRSPGTTTDDTTDRLCLSIDRASQSITRFIL